MRLETDIAIIGNGFSATALAINLVDTLPPTATVTMVGSEARLARGLAYSTRENCHRLNVPAGRMSMFPDRPNDFVAWLDERRLAYSEHDYVPRKVYGAYLADRLDQACLRMGNRAALSFVDAVALQAEAHSDGGHVFTLSDGRKLKAGLSALCIGASGASLPVAGVSVEPGSRAYIVEDPWADRWHDRLPRNGRVIFVGTGLTMVDQCLSLRRTGFRGRIEALSRRGLLPQPHLNPRTMPASPPFQPGERSLVQMLALLRDCARKNGDWRAAVDGLRPSTQSIWQAMDAADRSRFLRHAGPYWNTHRHRMAPEVAIEIDAMQTSGMLNVRRGRLHNIGKRDEGLSVGVVATRGARVTIDADLLVNCTGLDRCAVPGSALLSDMSANGMICCGDRGLGISTDRNSAVISQSGRASNRLFAVGAATAGQFWEITAVPDIREQARAVASALAERFRTVRAA